MSKTDAQFLLPLGFCGKIVKEKNAKFLLCHFSSWKWLGTSSMKVLMKLSEFQDMEGIKFETKKYDYILHFLHNRSRHLALFAKMASQEKENN
jgi:hypothetical protein